MTEVILISGVTKTLVQAYEWNRSSWRLEPELDKLREAIEIIKAVLPDAVKKQRESTEVSYWIRSVEVLLYAVDDLLDEIAADVLLEEQMKGNKQVRKFFLQLNPFSSSRHSAKKVKDLRKTLVSLAKDICYFDFARTSLDEKQINDIKEVRDSSSVKNGVINARNMETKLIIQFLETELRASKRVSVIAIVGIDGIGKTTLAQLVYNDIEVTRHFESRWWASLSNLSDEREILARISESMNHSFHRSSLSELYLAIMDTVSRAGNHLLVLDDLCEDNASAWFNIMSLLGGCAGRIVIIVTARSSSSAMCKVADRTFQLDCLTEEESWKLFEFVAFPTEEVNNPHRLSPARQIVNRCNGVPLAIKIMASLFTTKDTLQEWKSLMIKEKDESVMSTLILSYDVLPPILKTCLAYCSLFPKGYVFWRKELIYLWIGQGFVMPASDEIPVEELGHLYFMELLYRSFFQEATLDEDGEVLSCKMHDLVHDLAQIVAKDEIVMLSKDQNGRTHREIRHFSVSYEIDSSWILPYQLSRDDHLHIRSALLLAEGSVNPLLLEALCNMRFLRALSLGNQKIEVVPSSVGELKHLRYLNLSSNRFRYLPDSITRLVNLLTLDISWCNQLQLLPKQFRKLNRLRHLDTKGCYSLRYMPPGLEELTSLQCLSFFKVGKEMGADGLNSLSNLNLKGELEIMFDQNIVLDDKDRWLLPIDVTKLAVENYPGTELLYSKTAVSSNLRSLYIGQASRVKQIPPLRCLPSLAYLHLSDLEKLEYIIEEDENKSALKVLKLDGLPGLKGWSKAVQAAGTCLFHLTDLTIRHCQQLESMPLFPNLRRLELNDVNETLIQHLLSPSSAHSLSLLETIAIWNCNFSTFPGEALTFLRHLELSFCDELTRLQLAPPESNALQVLVIRRCPMLELWDETTRGVNWDSVPQLLKLAVSGTPYPDELPANIRHAITDEGASNKGIISPKKQKKAM